MYHFHFTLIAIFPNSNDLFYTSPVKLVVVSVKNLVRNIDSLISIVFVLSDT